MKQFTKQNLAEVKQAIDKALLQISKDYNINVRIGGHINFSSIQFSTRIVADITDFGTLVANTPDGFPTPGTQINGKRKGILTVVRLELKRAKPIVAKDTNGNEYYVSKTWYDMNLIRG